MTGSRRAVTGFPGIERMLGEVMRAELPSGMTGRLVLRQTFEDIHPRARIVLRCGGAEANDDVVLEDVHSPDAMMAAVRDAMPALINETWAAGLSLSPDEDSSVRERSYAIANAVDSVAAPTPTPEVEEDRAHAFPVSHACGCPTCSDVQWLAVRRD